MEVAPEILGVLGEYQVAELADGFHGDQDEAATRLGELGLDVSDAFLARAQDALAEMEGRGCRIVQVVLLEEICKQIKAERELFRTRGWKIVSKPVSHRVGIWVRISPDQRPFIVGVVGRAPIRNDLSVFEISQATFERLFVPCGQHIFDGQVRDDVRQLFVSTIGQAIRGDEDAETLLLMVGACVRCPEIFSSPVHLDDRLSGVIVDSINNFEGEKTGNITRGQLLRIWG